MAAQIVGSGIYMGFNLQEMEEELARYKKAVKNAGSDIASASYNGDSFTYGPRRDMNLQTWGEEIRAAFYMLGDTRFDEPASNMGVLRPFNNSRYA